MASRAPSGCPAGIAATRSPRSSECSRWSGVASLGLSLSASIERAIQDPEVSAAPSIFAGLRKSRPELAPYSGAQAAAGAHLARHGGRVLGARRRRRPDRLLPARDLLPRRPSRAGAPSPETAELSVVLGDFPEARSPRDGPVEIPIDRTHPLSREWAIVCDGPGVSACLAGWQRPGAAEDGQRVFEMLWSVEPEVVRDAARIGLELASSPVARAAATHSGLARAAARGRTARPWSAPPRSPIACWPTCRLPIDPARPGPYPDPPARRGPAPRSRP